MNDNEYKPIFNDETPSGGAAAVPQYTFVQKEKPSFTSGEKKLAILAAGLGFLFVHFVLWHATGFFTTLFYTAFISVTCGYLKKNGCKFSQGHKLWTAVLYVFSTVFSITANSTVKLLDVIFLAAGTAYLVYCVTANEKMFGRFLPFEMHNCVTKNPMSNLGKEFLALGSSAKGTHIGKNIMAIAGGCLIAVPLTVIVGSLLISADKGMEDMLKVVIGHLDFENIYSLLWELAVTIPASGYLFGLLYSHTNKERSKRAEADECERLCKNARIVRNTVAYTAVTPICVLYVMFFVSQANYFLSAFYGRLPEGYSFSEYARKGFFELFAIELINAFVIFAMNFFSKKSGEEKTKALKIYTVVISVFTLLITATAISKMVMYIEFHGLTQLRVYTTWFMVLTALIFVYVIIKQFRRDFAFMKVSAVTFTLMFALLCFSRVDALIARANLEYFSDKISTNDINVLCSCSCDSAAVIASPEYRDIIIEKYDDSPEKAQEMVFDRIEDKYNKTFYDKMNVSNILLNSRLNER